MAKKLIVITGASSGIGKALALKFAAEGYPLLLLARRVELLNQLNLSNAICKSVNVKDFENFKTAIKEAEEIYGKVDCLINNAGIMPLDKIYNLDLKTQHDMIDVNVKGVLNGMNIVLNDMKNSKSGTIINISSTAGRWTAENRTVYNASKFAVHAIGEQSRRELAPYNVRVLTIAPALVDTELISSTKNLEVIQKYGEWKTHLDGGLKPSTVADVIYYAFSLPQNISLKEIVLSATKQPI